MNISCPSRPMVVLACSILPMTVTASHAPEAAASSSQQLQPQLDEQARQIEPIGQAVADQETRHPVLQRLSAQEPCTLAAASSPSPTQPATNTSQRTVNAGSAPPHKRQPPAVAPLFDQPGILTSKGKFVLEPLLQNVYLSSNRLELQARLTYVYRSDATFSREIFTGSAPDHASNNSGKAMGDVELASLLLESSCRYSDKTAFSVTAGAGVTRDTPDLSLTLRVPLLF